MENNLQYFSRVTRSGNTLLKLVERIERIMNEQEDIDMNSHQCIICCNAKKAIILLPCRHQHTCEACWTLWRMHCMNREAERSFDSNDSDDDTVMKPTCPYCNTHVLPLKFPEYCKNRSEYKLLKLNLFIDIFVHYRYPIQANHFRCVRTRKS